MNLARTNLTAMLVCTAAVAATASAAAGEPKGGRPGVLTLERLRAVGLSAAQAEAVAKLESDLEPRLADAEAKAARTPAQKAAREKAIRAAIARGKRGAAARPMIAAASALTAEQQAAAERIGALRREYDDAVRALLSEPQKAKLEPPAGGPPEFTGFVVLRLAVDLPRELEGARSLEEVARALKLARLQQVLVELGLTDVRRLIPAVPRPQVPDPARQAEIDRLVRRLRSYWRADARAARVPVEAVLARLRAVPEIEAAYRQPALASPSVMPGDDPYCVQQGYLDPAPYGIDARYAWTKPNGDGAGVGLVDVEYDWYDDHEDLKGQSPMLIFGDKIPGDHGTGVLGTVVGGDNTVGVVGVAPNPAHVGLASWLVIGDAADHLAEGIVYSAGVMHPGDVMLLEVEGSGRPVELWDDYYDAIQLAVAQGVVVIEPAGNGHLDLDGVVDPAAGRHVLDRSSPDYRDSGAILVGASDPHDSHNRAPFSNFGSRVDCFAWGRYVVTCGKGDLDPGGGDPKKRYWKTFGGTSSATPIIGGAAMIVQARMKARTGLPATSQEMRWVLANPTTGTAQGTGVAGNIGIMPNLRAIIEYEESKRYGKHGR